MGLPIQQGSMLGKLGQDGRALPVPGRLEMEAFLRLPQEDLLHHACALGRNVLGTRGVDLQRHVLPQVCEHPSGLLVAPAGDFHTLVRIQVLVLALLTQEGPQIEHHSGLLEVYVVLLVLAGAPAKAIPPGEGQLVDVLLCLGDGEAYLRGA